MAASKGQYFTVGQGFCPYLEARTNMVNIESHISGVFGEKRPIEKALLPPPTKFLPFEWLDTIGRGERSVHRNA
jgi:hypothetical protein